MEPLENKETPESKAPEVSPQTKEFKASDYFAPVGSKKRVYLLPNGSKITFALGIPSNALDIYKSGFGLLYLKKGAEVLFQDLSNAEIEDLMKKAPKPSDVTILKKALKK